MAQLVAHHTGSVGVRGSSPLSSTIIPGQTTWDFLSRGPGMAEGISIGATQKWPVVAGGVGQRRWTAEVRAIALDRPVFSR